MPYILLISHSASHKALEKGADISEKHILRTQKIGHLSFNITISNLKSQTMQIFLSIIPSFIYLFNYVGAIFQIGLC